MTDYIVTRADEPELEHHGVKGQKWGVTRYKKARSKGIAAKGKLSDAKDYESDAQIIYDRAGNKMYKSMAKRDVVKDKAASAKSGSRKQARLTKKADKYNEKVKKYSNVRNEARNEVKNSRADIKKAQRSYNDAVRNAAKEKVQIKDHTFAKQLLAATLNDYARRNGAASDPLDVNEFKTDKDEFDEAVMAYRNKVR